MNPEDKQTQIKFTTCNDSEASNEQSCKEVTNTVGVLEDLEEQGEKPDASASGTDTEDVLRKRQKQCSPLLHIVWPHRW